jgi:uncharacterized protein
LITDPQSLDLMTLGLMGLALLGAGVLAGLVAGLFGVGGGTVIVPALFYAFAVLGLGGEANLHVAVGSSLAVIIATSLRSLAAHRRHGAVDEDVLRRWTPWVALGALIGAGLAGLADQGTLGIIYGVCVTLVALHMMFAPTGRGVFRAMPEGWLRRLIASVIGTLSAMMGVGGGALGGMVMTACGRSIHQAVATASGFGLAIGIPATIGFVVAGWSVAGRPPLSLGFVNAPAVLVMALVTTLVAPWGAALAHRLDQVMLKRAFAVFLLLTAMSIVAKAL